MVNKVALITGSSRGIGRGIALRLAKEGYAVIINSRRADPGNLKEGAFEVKRKIEEEGGRAFVCSADISLKDERRILVDYAFNEVGRVDLLVNNAGKNLGSADILEVSEERFDRVFSINLKGHFFLTQQVAKGMMEMQDKGDMERPRIVFISSVMAYLTTRLGSDYAIAKTALSMTARTFARRLGRENIYVFDIAPGYIYTDDTKAREEHISKIINDGNKLVTARWGQPEDVAAVVSAIARGDLDYSTGSTIEVGGGLGLPKL